jgi:Ca2+:H+ antiporter
VSIADNDVRLLSNHISGVFALVLPAAFFGALDRGSLTDLAGIQRTLRKIPLDTNHLNNPVLKNDKDLNPAQQSLQARAEQAIRIGAPMIEKAPTAVVETPFIEKGTHHVNPRELIPLLSDERRGEFLQFSRAIALVLLGMCMKPIHYFLLVVDLTLQIYLFANIHA